MQIVTRYILRQTLIGTVLVSIALACILWLSQSLRFIELLVKKGLSVLHFISLTMLLLPNFLVMILPISLFAVVLFTYNRLITDRELMVLKAAGVSDFALARPVLILAVAGMAVSFGLTLFVVPRSVEGFREMQWAIRNDVSGVLLQEGVFTEVTRGITVYVRSRTPEGELLGILIHDKRSARGAVTLMAERGALMFDERTPRVLMVNGNRQEVAEGGRLSLLYFDSYSVDIGTMGTEPNDRFRDARERPLRELLTMTEADGLQSVDVRRFRVEAHQRLTSPFYVLSFAVLAAAALLTAPFNRRGQAVRVGGAVAAVIGIEAAALGASNLAIHHLAAAPLIYVLAVGPLAAIVVLFGWPLNSVVAAKPAWRGRA